MESHVFSKTIPPRVRALLDRGVVVHDPTTVFVGDELDPQRVSPGVVVHAGCRLGGASTSIGPGCVLGEEAPATVKDCCLGRNVSLGGGFFLGSTFLDGTRAGGSAQIRPGTLLEEGAGVAHCVGLKQTILFPYVMIGSLVNFCDCLMAGGTGPANHGEVGSSYIHFNFTPHQDKATASLLGDVPRGVMLDKPPIFLGGQGGLVGPARVAFGTVVAAGVICRRDILGEGLLYTGRPEVGGRLREFRPGGYVGIRRVFRNNLVYLGNVRALRVWYQSARRHLMTGDLHQEACCRGALAGLDLVLAERLRRLEQVAEKIHASRSASGLSGDPDGRAAADSLEAFERLKGAWPRLQREMLTADGPTAGAGHRAEFLAQWTKIEPLSPYLEAVLSLDGETKEAGRSWLQAVVDEIAGILPGEDAAPDDEG